MEGGLDTRLLNEEEKECLHYLLNGVHPLKYATRTDGYRELPWLFWTDPSASSPSTDLVTVDKIRNAIQSLYLYLVQFWAPVWSGDQCVLTTSDQPFAMPYLCRQFCSFRQGCMGFRIRVDGEEGGVLGRVFRNRRSESTPNVDFYSDADYEPRQLALGCKIAEHLAVPVVDSATQNCVGVLEFLNYPIGLLHGFGGPPEVEGLKIGLPYDCQFAVAEHSHMRGMLEKMKEIRKVCLTQAWVACRVCGVGNICLVESVDTLNRNDIILNQFFCGCRMHPLQKGQGPVGKAYSSRKPYFCRDITTQFTSDDYPLVYYASHARLTQSFAICLYHTCSENYYIVELFFATGDCVDLRYILDFIRTTLQQFPNLQVAPGGESTGELHIEFTQPPMQMCHTMVGSTGNGGDNSMPGTSHHQAMVETEYASSGRSDDAAVNDAKKSSNTVPSTSYPQHTESTEISISYETLKQHFGRHLDDAADSIGVSRSTLKRISREHGINRWPWHKRHRPNSEQDVPPPSHLVPHHAQPVATIVTATQNENTMTVMAKYKKEYLRFGLPISSGMVELMGQLSKRLESNTTTYKIHYTDKHGRRIRVACNEDLQEYINTCRSQGKTTIDILVGH